MLSFALPLSAPVLAQESKEHTTDAETRYKGAPSTIDPSVSQDMITSEGPPMTVEEFAHGKKIFFERCAGCHGVLCKEATGKPFTTDITRARGDIYLKTFKTYGSPAGMPNWGRPVNSPKKMLISWFDTSSTSHPYRRNGVWKSCEIHGR